MKQEQVSIFVCESLGALRNVLHTELGGFPVVLMLETEKGELAGGVIVENGQEALEAYTTIQQTLGAGTPILVAKACTNTPFDTLLN